MSADINQLAVTRLSAARARLLLERPFLGSLVMYLPLKPASPSWCKTIATDARFIYYNPSYVLARTLPELQFLLCHEALHCALGHGHRRSHRIKRAWDVACDHAVNLLLTEEGMQPAPGCLADTIYKGLSAEEIYPLLDKATDAEPIDLHAFDFVGRAEIGALSQPKPGASKAQSEVGGDEGWSDAGNIAPSNPSGGAMQPADVGSAQDDRPDFGAADATALASLWRGRMMAAAQAARSHGALNRTWRRIVDESVAAQVPWSAILATRIMALARADYTYQRPSRREGDAIFPAQSQSEPRIVVALDTSGSVGVEEMRQFAVEVDALKGQIRTHVTLLACDDRLAFGSPWDFPPEKPFVLPEDLGGGGGTRFTPVFDWLDQSGLMASMVIYFTDALGEFPEAPPLVPVLWLVKGNAPTPWGERIQLN
jgi:predicted metal-dependent peptidase